MKGADKRRYLERERGRSRQPALQFATVRGTCVLPTPPALEHTTRRAPTPHPARPLPHRHPRTTTTPPHPHPPSRRTTPVTKLRTTRATSSAAPLLHNLQSPNTARAQPGRGTQTPARSRCRAHTREQTRRARYTTAAALRQSRMRDGRLRMRTGRARARNPPARSGGRGCEREAERDDARAPTGRRPPVDHAANALRSTPHLKPAPCGRGRGPSPPPPSFCVCVCAACVRRCCCRSPPVWRRARAMEGGQSSPYSVAGRGGGSAASAPLPPQKKSRGSRITVCSCEQAPAVSRGRVLPLRAGTLCPSAQGTSRGS